MSLSPTELVTPLAPELALAGGLVAVLVADLVPAARTRTVGPWLGIVGSALGLAFAATAAASQVGELLAIDAAARWARWLILGGALLVQLAGLGERRVAGDRGAWSAAVLGLALGASVASLASHCLPLWLGFELIAVSGYALVTFGGGDRRAAEAGMKFVLFGGVASAAMLFGMSHVYGATGHLDFAGIGRAFAAADVAVAAPALLLAALGLAYKLTLAPLHVYAPDVYQGSPPLAVAAVATMPKVAAAAALLRALQLAVPPAVVAPATLTAAIAAVAAIGMLVAATTALAQRCAKRILALSGASHGAILVLAAGCLPAGEASATVGYYLLTYVAANLGALTCLTVLEARTRSCDLAALAGSGQRQPWVASLLALFVLSLAGIPPLAGFFGKWGALRLALANGTAASPLVVVATLLVVAATVVAAWSYLLIVRAALLAPEPASTVPAVPRRALPWPTAIVLVVCALATLGLGFWLDGIAVLGGAS